MGICVKETVRQEEPLSLGGMQVKEGFLEEAPRGKAFALALPAWNSYPDLNMDLLSIIQISA